MLFSLGMRGGYILDIIYTVFDIFRYIPVLIVLLIPTSTNKLLLAHQ